MCVINHINDVSYFDLELVVVVDCFLSTRMMLSPLRNIFLIYLSLSTILASFPFSVHISLTSTRTMLKCLSKAFTRPINFLLFLRLMRTLFWFLTLSVRIFKGPFLKSSRSWASRSSGVNLLRVSSLLPDTREYLRSKIIYLLPRTDTAGFIFKKVKNT